MSEPKSTNFDEQKLVDVIRAAFPDVEAIYVFGSFADASESAESDFDVALLLPPQEAKKQQKNLSLLLTGCHFDLKLNSNKNQPL